MRDSERPRAFRLAALEARVYRAPVDVPVRTSFGVMHDRPAVLIRALDENGTEGWGRVLLDDGIRARDARERNRDHGGEHEETANEHDDLLGFAPVPVGAPTRGACRMPSLLPP